METLNKVHTVEKWDDMLHAMHSGVQTEINQEVYDYWLDVLPPVFMNKWFTFKDGQRVHAHFGFAEGSEPIVVFWKEAAADRGILEGERFYCRESSLINRSL